MNKVKRRIISGAIVFCCAGVGISAAAHISKKAESGAIPAAVTNYDNETPVIILDAGHGESTYTKL